MKYAPWLWPLVVAFLVVAPSTHSAEDKPKERPLPTTTKPQSSTPAPGTPVYKPPVRGAPGGRIGAGTRGLQRSLLGLAVLAPDHTGLTTQEQPDLYWYLPELPDFPIEFTLIEEDAILPVLETRISAPSSPGIQRFRMSAYNARLKLGTEYRWFVAIVVDPNSRSKDILAGGFIKRIEPTESLRTMLAGEAPERAPSIYAEEGIWYDALAALGAEIDVAPRKTALHVQRAGLLDQVGLQEIAAYETQR